MTDQPSVLSASPDATRAPRAEVAGGPQLEQALVPISPPDQKFDPIVLTPAQSRLPVQLDVSVPLPGFRVRDLLALECSNLIESAWDHGADVPLAAGDVQLAWSEFEVVDTQLAVRLTRLG